MSENKDKAKTMSDWQKNSTISQIKPLIEHKNYERVRDMFGAFYKDNSAYVSKASYILGMTRIISACRNDKVEHLVETQSEPTIGRRIIKS